MDVQQGGGAGLGGRVFDAGAIGGEDGDLAAAAADQAVDLVILDLNMPEMNGVETLARLRGLRPELPVLVASGYLDPGAAAAIASYAGVGALEKPFLLDEIRRAIAGLLP